MQDKSALQLKRAIPSQQEQRVLLTFGKSQPKNSFHPEFLRFSPSTPPPFTYSPLGPPSAISPVLAHCSPGLKQYAVIPNAGVLPPSNGLLVASIPLPAPVPMPMAVSVPIAMAMPPPRHPVPGTGVFLPPSGPDNFSAQQYECNGIEKPNGQNVASSPDKATEKTKPVPECNRVTNGDDNGVAAAQQSGSGP